MANRFSKLFTNLQFRNYSLRTKLVTGFLLLTTLPLIILGWQSTSTTRAILEQQAGTNILRDAKSASTDFQAFVDSQISTRQNQAKVTEILNYMGLPPSQRPGSQEESLVYQYLDSMSIQDPNYIESYKLIDLSGIDILDTTRSNIGTSYAGQDFFKSVTETLDPYVSGLIFSPQASDSSIYFAVPVRSEAELQIRGIYLVVYNASIIQELFDQRNRAIQSGASAYQGDSKYFFSFNQSINLAQPSATEYTYLIDSTNYFILGHSSRPDLLYKTYLGKDDARVAKLLEQGLMNPGNVDSFLVSEPEIVTPLSEMKTTVSFRAPSLEYNNEPAQMTAVRVPNSNWIIITAQPVSSITSLVQSQTRVSVITGIIITALAALLVFVVSNLFTRPIIELTQVAENISAGDFRKRAKIHSNDEIGTLATTINNMASQLSGLIGTLEQRVADRTKALATTTEVSRRLSTLLIRKELVTEVVNQVKNAFGYYHTQIYFYDEAKENLVLTGGTGEAGEIMLAQGHTIQKGRGLVGRAAETNAPVLVANVSQSIGWLPNPLLPETKSEMVIPISIGEQVLGVLDVQHDITDGLKQEDVDSLQSIANQVAVALQNIRQYENTQKIAADMETVAKLGISTSTITEIGLLLQEMVDLSKKSFNLYHAHIYLLNQAGDTLELSAGAGEVGRQMVVEKRSIPLDSDHSLVARAARTQKGVVVNDVTTAPDFLSNPLLPDTRSEMAVPMLAAGKVIGVLDVQSEVANRFTDVDISIQTTLASQIAVALQNARSFLQIQRQADRETAVNLITQKIQNATSVDAALQIAARELGHALGMKSTRVTLDPDALTDKHKGN
jgi:GAF domain-containing protein